MSPSFWRIARIGGIVSLVLIYLLWWGRMINNPAERSGADFIAFYAAGRIAQTQDIASIYGINLQQQIEQTVVGFELADEQVLLYNHMPYVVPLLALVVSGNYLWSFVRWTLILSGIYLAASIYLIQSLFVNQSQSTRITLVAVVLTFFPLFISLWQGQDTAFLYLGVALWYVGILKQKDWLAAIGLTFITTRPHIAIALFIPLLFGHWRVLWRFVLLAGALGSISIWMIGRQGLAQFVNLLLLSSEGDWFGMNQASMMNLLGIVTRAARFLDANTLSLIGWIIFVIGVVGICILWSHSKAMDERLLGLTVLIVVVTVPHLHLHDLTLLIFPLLFVAKRGILAFSQLQWALLPLGVSFILLSGTLWPLARFVLPYVLFAALAWMLWNLNGEESFVRSRQRQREGLSASGSNEN